jgi:hypothetical protein
LQERTTLYFQLDPQVLERHFLPLRLLLLRSRIVKLKKLFYVGLL